MRYDDLKLRISGVIVIDLRGEPVSLESIWENRVVLLAFLRHFG